MSARIDDTGRELGLGFGASARERESEWRGESSALKWRFSLFVHYFRILFVIKRAKVGNLAQVDVGGSDVVSSSHQSKTTKTRKRHTYDKSDSRSRFIALFLNS